MPVNPTYPGVYIEEIPSGVHTITGVATSIGAFVDFFPQGPLNEAVEIFSWGDFERQFGGLDERSEASYAIQQFFLNGGSQAWVVRVTSTTPGNGAVAAAIALDKAVTGGQAVLIATAKSPGVWGNNLRLTVDYGTSQPGSSFNLTVTELATNASGNTSVAATETYRNLVVDSSKSNDAATTVNAASQLITLATAAGADGLGLLPAQNGTSNTTLFQLNNLSVGDQMDVLLNGTKLGTITGLTAPLPTSYASLAQLLQTQIQAVSPQLAKAIVTVVGSAANGYYLVAVPNTGTATDALSFKDGGAGLATKLGMNPGAAVSSQTPNLAALLPGDTMNVVLNGAVAGTVSLPASSATSSYAALAAYLQAQIRGLGGQLANGIVALANSGAANYLVALPGTASTTDVITFAGSATLKLQADLGFTTKADISAQNPKLSTLAVGQTMDVSLNGGAPATTAGLAGAMPTTYAQLALDLQALIQGIAGLGSAIVIVAGDVSTGQYLVALPNTGTASDTIALTGTLGANLGFNPGAVSTSSSPNLAVLAPNEGMNVLLNGTTVGTVALPLSPVPSTYGNLAQYLQTQIQTLGGLSKAVVTSIGPAASPYLVALPGTATTTDVLTFTDTGTQTLEGKLGFGTAAPISSQNPNLTKLKVGQTMDVWLNGTKLGTTAGLPNPLPTTNASLAQILQSQIRAINTQLGNVLVSAVGSGSTGTYFVATPGTSSPTDFLALTDGNVGNSTLATTIGFSNSTVPLGDNIQQYVLGGTATQAQALPGATQQAGSDGVWDPSGDSAGLAGGLIGDQNLKTGMYALLNVDLFNILCIPATMNLPDTDAFEVSTQATGLCVARRAFYILDVPQAAGDRDTFTEIQTWLSANNSLRSRNAALYFPRVDLVDALNNYQLRITAPSGTLAGIYARTDANRGVWKAPAGTETSLSGVQSLEYTLIDGENGVLNPLAINCLRNFPVYGPVSWGARTLFGSDQQADDYKYIPVRRFALFLEESLYRGTQWVVFEPNDEPLWSAIRLNVGAFMQGLFRQGAFQGTTPTAAYFVKCDDETTTQNDINNGIVNIIVGFAPLKPAEFVIIQIQQISGQIQT